MAAMLISRPYLPFGDMEEFADRVLRSVCLGRIVSGALAPDIPPQEAITMVKGMLDEQQHGR